MWETILDGGVMMIPLSLCSVFVIAIIFERWHSLRRKKVIKPETISIIEKINSDEDVKMALSLCRESNDSFSNIICTALLSEKTNSDEIKELIEEQGRGEVRRLEKGLVILETIAGIAPLLGLLGTVIGMIEVFDVITVAGTAKTAALSGGISEALIATAFGLIVAIPAVWMFNYFTTVIENITVEMIYTSKEMIDFLIKSVGSEFGRSI
ncbi:MotA/TolQ/ExbB proton channel family protein, partial [candidate division KSB1 bacterium]|nr:MotA/TolQ/ExbB proton channel family protein [candidate division KSB1 bacterium]